MTNSPSGKPYSIVRLLSLFIILFSMLLASCHHVGREEDEGGTAEFDNMEKLMEQEFQLTRDPKLNRIPVERLLTAKATRDSHSFRMEGAVSGISWQERGANNVGGRTRALWFDLGDAANGYKKVWACGVSGGLWYTNDITAATPVWNKVDDSFDNLAISCFVQSSSNPQVMYFGTGEGWFNVDAGQGLGIWKSTDGGASWTRLTSTATFYFVQDLLLDNNDNLYATVRTGASGGASGLQKSADGGATWTQVLTSPTASSNRGADLELAANGDIYVSMGTLGSNGGIYRSSYATNGVNTGNSGTWVNITPNTSGTITTPASFWNRIELATAPSDGNVLYALFEGSGSYDCTSIQKYDAATNTWTVEVVPTTINQGSNSNFTNGQAWYDLIAAVDPNNANTLYIGGIDALRSDDGGATWTQMTTWSLYAATGFTSSQLVHADQHAIVYAPGSSSRLLWGTDGGIYYTTSGDTTGSGKKPVFVSKNVGYNVTQYYSCAIHPSTTNYFLAGAQDNGSQSFSTAGLNNVVMVSGGDGGFCHIDQDEPAIQITSYINNNYYVSTNGGSSFTSYSKNNRGGFINPTDYDNTGNVLYGGDDGGYYFRWTSPATNGADDQVAVSNFSGASVTHVAVSPITLNRVFFGLSNGSVVVVDDAETGTGKTGTIIKPATSGSVSCVAIDPADENHLLVTYSNYGVSHVWESFNALSGSPTWTVVDGDLPDMPVRWAMFDPRSSGWALLATELGVWSTDNLNGSSTSWTATNSGLANVRVDMLQYRSSDRTIAAATHGRGLFTAVVPDVSTPDINFQSSNSIVSEQTANTTGCRNYKDYDVVMTIANAPSGDATVTVNLEAGATATEGLDFDYTTNGDFNSPSHSFVFADGATASKTITVRVYDDAEVESAESFTFDYTISGTTTAQTGSGPQTHTFTINDNDAAPIPAGSNTYTVGTATYQLGSTTAGQPFDAIVQNKRTQMLYKASELAAAGMSAGTITSIAFDMSKNSTRAYQNLEIKMGSTSADYLVDGSVTVGAVTSVKSLSSYNTVNGWNTFTLDNPYTWDGTSNIVVEICYDNGSTASGDQADITLGYSDGGSASQGNMFWQDGIGCSSSFSSVNYYGSGIKPTLQLGLNITGTPVDTVLNTSRSEYLGPNSDVYFYSSGGELMARIQNLTSHDYGCTQVVIDRSGTGSAQFWNNTTSQYLMDKTFHIIPTTNDASGSYTITLYYNAAEVDGWQAATGQSFSNIQLVKVPSQISNVTPSNPEPDGSGTVEIVTPTRGTLGTNYTLTYSFNDGFSGFGAGIPGVALPVTLIDFSGRLQNDEVALSWKTSTESNSYGFEIQRSYTGTDFTKIGFVQAAGNSSVPRNYSFTDPDIAQENNYYRLKMIDSDGNFIYSKVVLVKDPLTGSSSFKILDNPVGDNLDLQFDKAPGGKVQVQILDITGKQLMQWSSENFTNPRLRIPLDGRLVSKGVYVVRVWLKDRKYAKRFVKD